jgi:hypothetical protein
VGDDEAEVEPRAPAERDARDRMLPAAGAGGNAPYLAAALEGETYGGEPEREYGDDVRE